MQRNYDYYPTPPPTPTGGGGGANVGYETDRQVPKCKDADGRKGETAFMQKGHTSLFKMVGAARQLPQPRLHKLQQAFNRAPLEERRRLANQARYSTVAGPAKC
jgi:hypothetical protein